MTGTIHQRRCWDCDNIAEHSDNVAPEVCCKKCGSQDTRPVKTAVRHGSCGHAALYQPPGSDAQLIADLRKQINELQIDLDLANLARRDALDALKEFQGYDGDDDLWALMKQERDELRRLLFAVINGDTVPDMSGRINRALEGFEP